MSYIYKIFIFLEINYKYTVVINFYVIQIDSKET